MLSSLIHKTVALVGSVFLIVIMTLAVMGRVSFFVFALSALTLWLYARYALPKKRQ